MEPDAKMLVIRLGLFRRRVRVLPARLGSKKCRDDAVTNAIQCSLKIISDSSLSVLRCVRNHSLEQYPEAVTFECFIYKILRFPDQHLLAPERPADTSP